MSDGPYRLRLCDEPSGAPRMATPEEIDKLGAAVPSALLLLVHGYNNDVSEATAAFEGFETLQSEMAGSPDYAPGVVVARVFWPAGDHFWQFMDAIRRVPAAAAMFADTLEAVARVQGRPLFVSVVAHSLGCRLTFEAIRALSARPGSPVIFDRLMFFAAAVATELLEAPPDTRQLRQSYAVKVQGGARSLYSPADEVLSLAFPLGSTLAGNGEPKLATALGHDYWASASRPGDLGQAENRGAGHSDYWGWKAKTAPTNGRFAGEEARAFLQLANGKRPIGTRYVPDRADESREQQRRELERRIVAESMYYMP